MEMDDAISLLLKAAFLDESSDELRLISKSIATELCFLALAVDQAGPGVTVAGRGGLPIGVTRV